MCPPIKSFLLKSGLVAFLVGIWLMLSPADYANANEITVQISPNPTPSSDPAPVTAVTVASVEEKINTAETTLQQVAQQQGTAITTTIQANVPNTTMEQAATIATNQEPIATAVAEATVKVQEAATAIQSAETAVALASTAKTAVETQVVVVAEATTNLNNAQASLDIVTQQVVSQTTVVATDTTELAKATASVQAQTVIVATETAELNTLQNTPSDTKTYTTAGYVAPVAPENPTVTTTTLPEMYDGFTKINTPFDIKMGNTIYEGQGAASQIYVSSKATITFGNGDVNWWDFPTGAHISVFGSDFQSAGPNAGITVTTTETTLAVDWDLHLFGNPGSPLTNVNWTMTVNPTTGEWTGVGTVAGNTTNLYNGPRTGVRESAGEAVKPMTNVTNEDLTNQIADQTEVVAEETSELNTLTAEKVVAETNLTVSTTVLNTLQAEKVTAEELVVDKTQIKQAEVATLNQLTETATVTVQTANALANTATTKVDEAVTAMTNAAQITTNYYAEQRALVIAEAQRQAEDAAEQAEASRIAAEKATVEAAAQAKAAEEAAAKAEADRVAAEEAAAQAQAEAAKAEADRIAAEEAAAQAEEEARAAEEAEAQAEAERLEAEAEAARQAEENARAEAEAAEAEAEAARQAEEDAKAEAEAKEAELEAAKAEEEAAQKEEEELKEILEEAKDGKELTEEQKEVLVEALLEDLKPGESISAAEVKASGVSYADLPPSTPVELRTDENGNALVITAAVAANIELVQNPGALLSAAFNDPGAALAAFGSIGADMTEAEREEATDMVVATVVAAGAAINAASVAAGGATGGSTGGGGSSGGGSGANSPGSRGGRKW
jgi:hypothetical protein